MKGEKNNNAEQGIGMPKESSILNIHPNVFHDISMYTSGFARNRTKPYILYIGFVFLLFTFISSSSIYNILLVYHEFVYIITEIHLSFVTQFVTSTLLLRLVVSKHLNDVGDMLIEGVYTYENEEFDSDMLKIKKKVQKEWKKVITIFTSLYYGSFCLIMIVSPILAYLFMDNSKWFTDPAVSQYLPHMFYSPFGFNTILGFILTYGVDFVFWIVGCSTTFSTVKLFLLVLTNVKLHLKILNHSLNFIHSRALKLYSKKYGVDVDKVSLKNISTNDEFNDCLRICLRENIRHHQRLIKFKNSFQYFSGPTIAAALSFIIVIVYAFLLYLTIMKLPISMRLKYFCMFLSEGSTTLILCLQGEEVVAESDELYRNLYKTSWFHYDKHFKQMLHIMMQGTKEPMVFKATVADGALTRECYGNIVKATYSLMNLLGQFDTL